MQRPLLARNAGVGFQLNHEPLQGRQSFACAQNIFPPFAGAPAIRRVDWLLCRPVVTKVQLPTLYLRNLDSARPCAILEFGPAPWRLPGDVSSRAPGRGAGFFDNSWPSRHCWNRGAATITT